MKEDPAIRRYLSLLASKHGNAGTVPRTSQIVALSSPRAFLEYLELPIGPNSVTRLIEQTRAEHRQDNFQLDERLLAFSMNPTTKGRYNKAATIKGIFKANYCPLNVSLPAPTKPERTRQISHGIMDAIYDSLPRDELRAIIDLQAFAGERVACLCALTPISSWEDFDDRYTLIRIKARNTKARYDHVSIIPKPLADYLRAYAKTLRRSCPFPNYETLWREIRGLTLKGFGLRLTSHYLRKRFATIAAKTRMPVNSWDYLMGDKPSLGHHAEAYSLEDYSSLVAEYDKYLVPYLPIKNHREPDEPVNLMKQTPDFNALLKTIETLQETIKTLTVQLAESRTH